MPRVEDVGVCAALGQPNLTIKVDRSHSARYGLTPSDVNAVVQAALGGQPVTDVYEGERHFPLNAFNKRLRCSGCAHGLKPIA